MGEAYKLSCKSCTYSQNVYLGPGFFHSYLENIINAIKNETDRSRLKEFSTDKSAFHIAHEGLYVCATCRALQIETYVWVKSDTDLYGIRYTCTRCSEPLPSIPLDELFPMTTVLACPDCTDERLDIELYMDWD